MINAKNAAFKAAGVFCGLLMLSGCATIVSKNVYPVALSSVPDGVRYEIAEKDSGRLISAGVTPHTVMLKSSDGFFSRAEYVVTFRQEGYHSSTVPLRAGLDGWYFGNIIFGGLLGILIIDPVSGAMWKLDHNVASSLAQDMSVPVQPPLAPESLVPAGEPVEEVEAAIVPQDAVTLMQLDQVPPAWRPYLVPVI